MTADELLHLLYTKEKPFLQTNDWSNLRIRVADLIAAAGPATSPNQVSDLLRSLRLDGRLMFFPDWQQWGIEEDETDGVLVDSRNQWEPSPGSPDPPSWVRRQAFIPNDLNNWSVRSRVAETARLLFANRERFGLEAATAHLGYQLQERYRPDRTAADIKSVVARLESVVDDGASLTRASDKKALKLALQIVGAALGHSRIAAFQERAWETILRSLFDQPRLIDATMITAGVSSGKTFGFLLPTLTLLVYRALRGEGGKNRALIIYPRTSLVEDQYHSSRRFLAAINTQLAAHQFGTSLTEHPALDAGQMLAQSLGLETSSLAETLPHVGQQGIEIILTTPESLKNRMLDPRAVRTYFRDVEVIILDEIHLMEGLSGCHGIYFIRRLRQLLRDLRGDPNFEPVWVGASATVAEPTDHCGRVLSLSPTRVAHVSPGQNELVRFGTFHHIFLHTRVGKPSISAVTNGLSCLVHTRNDCTAFAHYTDPAGAVLQSRSSEQVPKTLTFVDSLSTIGRLRFTTADNEKTYDPYSSAPPYYSWFYRPAARLGATAMETRSIGAMRLAEVRDWCGKCFRGVPARLDSTALKSPEFSYLRTLLRMDDKAKARARPPGFAEELQRLSGPVGNLDQCPFHKYRICWWFSQDSGERRTIGNGQICIDQNRAIAYTSKTDDLDLGLHENVNDYFLTSARNVWQNVNGIPDRDEVVSTLLASPRIEVGVDFSNVRDGATHKAMRSAASFQQKVGRVGREDRSDSVIVTFLAHRPTDAHFAHHPARLIDSSHLDPIPLKSVNPDVLRNHMFAAGFEFIASRRPGVIPNAGHELNIIGTGSGRVPDPWEDKVRACINFLGANRPAIRAFMLGATGEGATSTSVADEAIASLMNLLNIFVADLTGAYSAGRTAAHWFKENQVPAPTPGFVSMLTELESVSETLRQALIGAPASVHAAANALIASADAQMPTQVGLNTAATNLLTVTTSAMAAGLPPTTAGLLVTAVGKAQGAAGRLASIALGAPLQQLKRAHAIIQAFFQESDPGKRRMEQYYFHDILTRFLPFREFYPFGLVRTHFQHINSRQVQILLPNDAKDSESLATSLYELLPGTWNYRWLGPRKSPCGRINQLAGSGEHFANLSQIEGPNSAAFEETGATLTSGELPPDMPAVPAGVSVPILRPVRLKIELSYNRPEARFDNQLIADDDESDRIDDPQLKRQCPTLPRSFPATWYRVALGPGAQPVVGKADPDHPTTPLDHTMPAIGRVLFDQITFSTDLRADRYVYAIDRSYGSGGIESPRIHYRHGTPPNAVVIGDTLPKTDGLTFCLKKATLDAVVASAVGKVGPLRGELTIRALWRFIAQSTGCGPFQAEIIRKVLLMQHLDGGGTLDTLDAASVQSHLSMTKARYDAISGALINGTYAGVDAAEARGGRTRQAGWYEEAWTTLQRIQTRGAGFTSLFVAGVAKDILVHSVAVTVLDGVSRLVGAADGDLAYFHRADQNEFYVFDSVEGGNGCAETIGRFLQIPPLRRILAARGGTSGTLPSADGFMLIEEALGACPAQAAARLLVETCDHNVSDAADLRFPHGLVADLQARMRHEYDSVAGARAIVDHLLHVQPAIFSEWTDLIWLQVLPERFAPLLETANVCSGIESLRSRTHLCVTGCLECVDNGDQSIYGALTSREYVSKNLLDALKLHIVGAEPQAFVATAAGAPVGAVLQAQSGRPVTDSSGAAVTAVVDDQGTPRQVLLTQVLSTVAPDLGLSGATPLLTKANAGSAWDVNIPFLAGYRDERPVP